MDLDFVPLSHRPPGTIAALLRTSYAPLLNLDPRWKAEAVKWEEYDREANVHAGSVGACLFFTRFGGRIAGFGSWDPRRRPEFGLVGHNCILPEFQGRGLGKLQIQEILKRLQLLGIKAAKALTNDHPFFVPAQRMYLSSGFREVRRCPWAEDPALQIIEYRKDLALRD